MQKQLSFETLGEIDHGSVAVAFDFGTEVSIECAVIIDSDRQTIRLEILAGQYVQVLRECAKRLAGAIKDELPDSLVVLGSP